VFGLSVKAASKQKLIPLDFGSCSLSQYIERAHDNAFATFVKNKNNCFSDLREINDCFQKISDALDNPQDILPAFLLIRSFSAYRASCNTAMSGQVVETFVLLRSCLEFAGYALLMQVDRRLVEVWLKRHNGLDVAEKKKSKSAVKKEFIVGRIKEELVKKDAQLGGIFDLLYERSIDEGGHPNERAVFGSMRVNAGEGVQNFEQIYLHGDDVHSESALKTTAQVGLCSLSIFENIFPKRFSILGIKDDLKRIKKRF
jgi:hypothetical protein